MRLALWISLLLPTARGVTVMGFGFLFKEHGTAYQRVEGGNALGSRCVWLLRAVELGRAVAFARGN